MSQTQGSLDTEQNNVKTTSGLLEDRADNRRKRHEQISRET